MLNLLATPGLGSLLCGRWIAGTGQLLLSIAGFVVFMVWFVKEMGQFYSLINIGASSPPPQQPIGQMAGAGIGLIVAAWLWSAMTSVSLMREAAQNQLDLLNRPAEPPKLSDLPKKDNQRPYV